MRYGSRCQELQCCWFFTQQFSVCINNGPPPKGHPANLTQLWEALGSTWASIPVEYLTPCRVHARRIVTLLRAKGGATQYKKGVPNVLYTVYNRYQFATLLYSIRKTYPIVTVALKCGVSFSDMCPRVGMGNSSITSVGRGDFFLYNYLSKDNWVSKKR